jgi:hypothetical protein
MAFRILGLSAKDFAHLFELFDLKPICAGVFLQHSPEFGWESRG